MVPSNYIVGEYEHFFPRHGVIFFFPVSHFRFLLGKRVRFVPVAAALFRTTRSLSLFFFLADWSITSVNCRRRLWMASFYLL